MLLAGMHENKSAFIGHFLVSETNYDVTPACVNDRHNENGNFCQLLTLARMIELRITNLIPK
jgi:hypothetical protein